jgi:hypothetical protein
MSEKDLIPINKRTKEEQKEIARRGGIASQKKQREKKTMKEQLKLLLSLELKDKKTAENLKKMGVNIDNIDNQMALNVALWAKALQGDVQAFNSIRDTIGEKPTDKVETVITYEEKLKEVADEDEY